MLVADASAAHDFSRGLRSPLKLWGSQGPPALGGVSGQRPEKPGTGLSLPFIPSALEIEGFCKSLPYAYALFASTDYSRNSEDSCGGQRLWEGQEG